MNTTIPALGIQVNQSFSGPVAEFYGPPTDASDFPGLTFDVAVPFDGTPDGTPLPWEVKSHPQPITSFFDVVSGPTSGTLGEGQEVSLEVAPNNNISLGPGVFEETLAFFDYTYETREPILHRVFVGTEGFTLSVPKDLTGDGGLGLPTGTQITYDPRNRWIVPQDVTLSAGGAGWILFDNVPATSPSTHTLPPVDAPEPPVDIAMTFDDTEDCPIVRTAQIEVASDDSGFPTFRRTQNVKFDHLRQIETSSMNEGVLEPGEWAEATLTFASDPIGGTVSDADVYLLRGFSVPADTRFSVALTGPQGQSILLKDFEPADELQVAYDQDELTPLVLLDNVFVGTVADGPWTLRLTNWPSSQGNIRARFTRWDVRLTIDDGTVCP